LTKSSEETLQGQFEDRRGKAVTIQMDSPVPDLTKFTKAKRFKEVNLHRATRYPSLCRYLRQKENSYFRSRPSI
jgi:hypothetical protein